MPHQPATFAKPDRPHGGAVLWMWTIGLIATPFVYILRLACPCPSPATLRFLAQARSTLAVMTIVAMLAVFAGILTGMFHAFSGNIIVWVALISFAASLLAITTITRFLFPFEKTPGCATRTPPTAPRSDRAMNRP